MGEGEPYNDLPKDPPPAILLFSLLPRTCALTGKRIWLEKAYRLRYERTGYTGMDQDDFWFKETDFVVARLKGIV